MIALSKGAKVYLPGEWTGSTRSQALYHAKKLGGVPKANVRDGVLFVWPDGFNLREKTFVMTVVGKVVKLMRAA